MDKYTQSSVNYINKWKEVQKLWQQTVRSNNNPKSTLSFVNYKNKDVNSTPNMSSLVHLDEFIQDINKRVVMTKVKINEFAWYQRISSVQQCVMGQFVFLKKEQYEEMREKYRQIQVEYQSCKIKADQIEKLLEQKNEEIKRITLQRNQLQKSLEKKSQFKDTLNVKTQIQTPPFTQNKSSHYKKPLSIDIQIVESSQLNYPVDKPPSNNTFLTGKLPQNDPVFKIPCLSPTMIQMKCIEKMEIQRRKKLRQLRKDPTGTKLIVNELNHMAAGVPSTMSQSMINDAINPNKNKFIRKPMSSVLGSLYLSPKQTNQISEKPKNYDLEEENQCTYEGKQEQEMSSKEQDNSSKDDQKQQKLNLPYFISIKKKNQQHQK